MEFKKSAVRNPPSARDSLTARTSASTTPLVCRETARTTTPSFNQCTFYTMTPPETKRELWPGTGTFCEGESSCLPDEDESESLAVSESDLSIKECMTVEVCGKPFYLYRGRLLTYEEAYRIFNALYNSDVSEQVIEKEWNDNEIILLNWVIINYASQTTKTSFSAQDWEKISTLIPGRTPAECKVQYETSLELPAVRNEPDGPLGLTEYVTCPEIPEELPNSSLQPPPSIVVNSSFLRTEEEKVKKMLCTEESGVDTSYNDGEKSPMRSEEDDDNFSNSGSGGQSPFTIYLASANCKGKLQ